MYTFIMNSVDPEMHPIVNKLIDVQITNENMALNVIVSYMHIALKRGTFSFEEAGKINECIQKFQKNPTPTPIPTANKEIDTPHAANESPNLL
jgi:hypothetical protein